MVTQDGQVIFSANGGIYGVVTRFAFEFKGTGWYLVDFTSSFGHIYAPHLTAAIEWLDANYRIHYNDGVGVAHYTARS